MVVRLQKHFLAKQCVSLKIIIIKNIKKVSRLQCGVLCGQDHETLPLYVLEVTDVTSVWPRPHLSSVNTCTDNNRCGSTMTQYRLIENLGQCLFLGN